MTPEKYLRALVNASRSTAVDNLYRVQRNFADFKPSRMNQPWGNNGESPAYILADYTAQVADADAALLWLDRVAQSSSSLSLMDDRS